MAEETPREERFRWPAEWEEHAATWLVWPHNRETWPGKIEAIPGVFAAMVRALLPGERIEILVASAEAEAAAEKVLRDRAALAAGVNFHRVPTNDSWIRDHGPIFLQNGDGRSLALDWGYNAWGGKYPPWNLDEKVATAVAAIAGVEVVHPGMILEGGAIEGDGAGTLLTTEACLLNPNRNALLGRSAIEECLSAQLGVSRVLWLADGIAGDDTDGHIDELTRFVAPGVVVTAIEKNLQDENYKVLRANRERLESMHDACGRRIEIIDLPMPAPLFARTQRLPASYANFYIGNAAVLVPTFSDPSDTVALGILGELFPDRRVIGLDARDLVWGLGAFHCLTLQQPATVLPARL